jgi:methyltransferase family protein
MASIIVGNGAQGSLLACRSSKKFQNKVFYVVGDKRHQVLHEEWGEARGLSLCEVQWVQEEQLASFRLGAPLSKRFEHSDGLQPINTKDAVREAMAAKLTGQGMEFGAGPCPFPLPLHCQVAYADRLSKADFEIQYAGYTSSPETPMDPVEPDFIMDLQDLSGIPDQSLDFVVASHVIEHTPNPLLAFDQVYSKLRCEGRFLLVVPDKRRTFDRLRELTSLQHLVLDYRKPSRKRDILHYLEVYSLSFPVRFDKLERTADCACASNTDIHYHTSIYESFMETVEYSRRAFAPWSEIWAHPTLADGDEFYFLLTR